MADVLAISTIVILPFVLLWGIYVFSQQKYFDYLFVVLSIIYSGWVVRGPNNWQNICVWAKEIYFAIIKLDLKTLVVFWLLTVLAYGSLKIMHKWSKIK